LIEAADLVEFGTRWMSVHLNWRSATSGGS
jgi:hypothetical protein